MAEAFTRKYADRFEIYSAGLEPKGINPYTIRVMEEIGAAWMSNHQKALTNTWAPFAVMAG